MATLKGKGAMTGVNLLVTAYNNAVTSNGKSVYYDVEVDHRDPKNGVQTNPKLKTEVARDKDGQVIINPNTGKQRYNNGAPYSIGQADVIKEAAGDNKFPILNKDGSVKLDKEGQQAGWVYAVKADLMKASRGSGLVINTKTVEPSDFKVDAKTMDAQYEAAEAARAASREAQASAPAPEAQAEQTAEAEAPAPEVDEPAVG